MDRPFVAFSIVVITLNEEQNIERCLNSIMGLTDDIVVLDSFSVDRTVELCRNSGANVQARKFTNYSDQKNYANSLARYDWIVSLDADEEVDPVLRQALENFRPKSAEMVYSFDRKTNYCGKWIAYGGLRHDHIIRAFNKNVYCWAGTVHEQLSPEPRTCKRMPGRLNHYTYSSFDQHVNANIAYARLQSESYFSRRKKVKWYHLSLSPGFRFLKLYIFNLGFLDGLEGFFLAKVAAFYTFCKYARLKWLYRNAS
jgi:glycosyltransferase involved in cell wall biosynthesis